MMTELEINKHNFSKIGKYISNKLHHVHKQRPPHSRAQTNSNKTPSPKRENSKPESLKENTSRSPRTKHEWFEPSVGSYRVDYSAVDKNIHQYNFNRSTPHFFGQKHKANQSTSLTKQYPDGPSPKQKGFTELARMVGRHQIKGSIRKNLQNPHQSRFEVHHFPTLSTRGGGVQFEKMSARTQPFDNPKQPLPEYDCNYEVSMKRLDSHIISFEKQTSRDNLFKSAPFTENFRNSSDRAPFLDKTVAWSKQLPREADGILPSYMDKTVTSRMAISLINLKTLEMNCSNMKEGGRKLQRRRVGGNQKTVVYNQKEV